MARVTSQCRGCSPCEGAAGSPAVGARRLSRRRRVMTCAAPSARRSASKLGTLAAACLKLEVATYPKPGLVSHVDRGAHHDMDASLLARSADTLAAFFSDLALA